MPILRYDELQVTTSFNRILISWIIHLDLSCIHLYISTYNTTLWAFGVFPPRKGRKGEVNQVLHALLGKGYLVEGIKRSPFENRKTSPITLTI